MHIRHLGIICLLLLSQCQSETEKTSTDLAQFPEEIAQLKDYFHIPGMAVLVQQDGKTIYEDYLGFSNLGKEQKVDSSSLFPVASLSKTFASTLVMQLVEAGEIELGQAANQYISEPPLPDSILVEHLLSHTSQGPVGEEFYYSFRYGLLTPIIEKVSGKAYAQLMQERIFDPLSMENTFLLKDSAQVAGKGVELVAPYFYEGEATPGFIDYGYSASAGVVSNVRELATFYSALQKGDLTQAASVEQIYGPYIPNSPYGFGIFNQTFMGEEIIWAYGQYDCYSSLYVYVPSKDLQLFIMANNNLMSDPARLICGDATSSLFVLSFLKNFVFPDEDFPILISKDGIKYEQENKSPLRRETFLAQALAESFLARYDTDRMQSSTQILDYVFATYPNYTAYADLSVLHNLLFLTDIADYLEMETFDTFDRQIEQIGQALLKKDPLNPYTNVYLGSFYDKKENKDKARMHYQTIVNAPNFSRFWYTNQAEAWLKNQGE